MTLSFAPLAILAEAEDATETGFPDDLGDVVPTEFFAAATTATLRIVLIIVVAYLLNRLVKRLIKRFVTSLKEQGMERLSKVRSRAPLADTRPMDVQRATMRTETIGGVLHSIASFAIATIAVMMILGEIGLNLGPLIAGAGIVGVALGFGAQKLVQDFLSGIFMLLEDQYGIGDIVDTGEAVGTIEGISLRTTRLRDVFGTVWHVPNGEIRRVGNFSQEWSRALLDIGVAYDTDLDLAMRTIKETADETMDDPEWADFFVEAPEMWGVQALGDSEITLRLVIKVVPLKQWAVERELRKRVKQAFDEVDIEIPFPQRTVWTRPEEPGAMTANGPKWHPATGHLADGDGLSDGRSASRGRRA